MKIALYIEDGLEQIILSPESETERGILNKLHDGQRDVTIHRNQFFHTTGGFVRQGAFGDKDSSTMIVLRPRPIQPTEDHQP